MANATAITVTELTLNGSAAQPTADVLDTGSTAVTISADVKGLTGRVIIIATNTAANNLDVEVLAGDKPPAQNAGQGGVSATLAQNAVRVFGPFEAGRFAQNDGKLDVKFTPSSGTIAANVRCYRLPVG